MISELARKGLNGGSPGDGGPEDDGFCGFHPLPKRGRPVTNEVIFDRSRIHGPRQLTDVYLLGLAAHHGGRLVTFDRTIALAAVPTARPANLVVL